MITSGPVVVFYKSNTCTDCASLSNIWNNVVNSLKKINSKIRFFIVSDTDHKSEPKDLVRYKKWFPMILLIPGNLWDHAMLDGDVELIQGVLEPPSDF